jgi:dTDP-4-dehydrorhamnose 3,5-epimerase
VEFISTDIDDFWVIETPRHGDHRGFFSEIFRADLFKEKGLPDQFIQDNHSMSRGRGVIRGLHYQFSPKAQAKVVRVTRGAILDIVVDIRQSSTTFGQHVAVELSDRNWRQLVVPIGMAHGFVTLSDEVEVQYKCSNSYAPELERGILWSDPALQIDWPIDSSDVVLSDRDRAWPVLADQPDLFD